MKGATVIKSTMSCMVCPFQSTHPWRVRRENGKWQAIVSYISIHAPMKGATCTFALALFSSIAFQSTHPWRVRHTKLYKTGLRKRFQSTHPWRVRHANIRDGDIVFINFNLRTHEGCDTLKCGTDGGFKLFQSTHPWRVRLNFISKIGADKKISIHAPMKGATIDKGDKVTIQGNFNPRTHEGCDWASWTISCCNN